MLHVSTPGEAIVKALVDQVERSGKRVTAEKAEILVKRLEKGRRKTADVAISEQDALLRHPGVWRRASIDSGEIIYARACCQVFNRSLCPITADFTVKAGNSTMIIRYAAGLNAETLPPLVVGKYLDYWYEVRVHDLAQQYRLDRLKQIHTWEWALQALAIKYPDVVRACSVEGLKEVGVVVSRLF